jgi:hypothetical protein
LQICFFGPYNFEKKGNKNVKKRKKFLVHASRAFGGERNASRWIPPESGPAANVARERWTALGVSSWAKK